MRITVNNHIKSLWDGGGPFIGDDGAPHGRVTVEVGWELRRSAGSVIGTYDHGPIRWFQRSDNSQVETEVPNVKSIEISRTIDTDAGTCDITLTNTKMLQNGEVPVNGTESPSLGKPGYYTFTRGDSHQSLLKWGQSQNEWHDVLQPNALIRTYQGYGGKTKSIHTAIADGNLLLTGTWLVDDVKIDAHSGDLTINCRDMVKLLIEQELYPPLCPTSGSVHYPISYSRWKFINHELIPYGSRTFHVGYGGDNVGLTATASSSDIQGLLIDGHKKSDAIDGTDPSSYWLSGGHVGGDASDDMEYLEFTLSRTINGCNLQPFAGQYITYYSVMVDGVWQGDPTQLIPYTGTVPGMKIPYVAIEAVGWEQSLEVYLGATYNADRIRVTFAHLAKTSVGPKFYRAGIRNFDVGTFSTTVTAPNERKIVGIQRGYASAQRGYWLAGSDGGVFTFGNLKFFGSRGGKPITGTIVGIASEDSGAGYRLAGSDGGVFCFGDAQFFGSLPGLGITTTIIAGIENGDHGYKGYYLFDYTGAVFAFGNAVYHGNSSFSGLCMSMASHLGGYWLVNELGVVEAHGALAHYGDLSASPPAHNITAIESTSTGHGYWLVDDVGAVYAFGDATYWGGANNIVLSDPIVDITATGTDQGYQLVGADGGVFAYGDAHYSGSLPQQFQAIGDGNYKDYTDIVKDIVLWCGWWFRNPALGDNSPAVPFGNYESTGIFSPQTLTEDFFDQKPCIDVINALKEIVGYIIYADETGAFHFESPNVWSIGNFFEDGRPTSIIPVLDESLQLTEYSVSVSDTDARSTITIANSDPTLDYTDLKAVTVKSQWGQDLLNGIVRPALWVNGEFVDPTVIRTMAELIDLHLFMAQRQGNVTIPANPILQIGDQIRIYERTTSDTYVHYLRGYASSMDLESGSYTMSIQTHWMGDGSAWFLKY